MRALWLGLIIGRPGSSDGTIRVCAAHNNSSYCVEQNRVDILPLDLWHNVPMAQAISISAISTTVSGTDFDWKAVERGLPLSALEEFCAISGLALRDLLEVVIPARTLKHRRQRKEPLSLDESDRLVRVKRVFDLALSVWSNRENAKEWLMTAQERFEGKTPLAMLRTQAGERAVEEFLIQIDEGYFV